MPRIKETNLRGHGIEPGELIQTRHAHNTTRTQHDTHTLQVCEEQSSTNRLRVIENIEFMLG